MRSIINERIRMTRKKIGSSFITYRIKNYKHHDDQHPKPHGGNQDQSVSTNSNIKYVKKEIPRIKQQKQNNPFTPRRIVKYPVARGGPRKKVNRPPVKITS